MSEEKYCLTLADLVELCSEIMSYAPHEDKFFEYSLYIELWLKDKKEREEVII